jgi:lipoprotein NlpD
MSRMKPGLPALLLIVSFCSQVGCAHDPVPPLQLLGTWHQVQSGDSVRSVAKQYGADATALAELNDLPLEGAISGRDEIFVPKSGGKAPGTGAPPPSPLVAAAPATGGASGQTGSCVAAEGSCLAWPVDGEIAVGFGERSGVEHDGIDIPAPRGTAVEAAAAGQVLYSGAEIKGYGNLVIIRHAGGIITVYAHNDENLVAEGDQVKKGQPVAKVGDSGTAKTTHLHFEVRVDERPRDPLKYLVPRKGD